MAMRQRGQRPSGESGSNGAPQRLHFDISLITCYFRKIVETLHVKIANFDKGLTEHGQQMLQFFLNTFAVGQGVGDLLAE